MTNNAEHGQIKKIPTITPLSPDQNNMAYDDTEHANDIASPAGESKTDVINSTSDDDHTYDDTHTASHRNHLKPFPLMNNVADHGHRMQTPNISPPSPDQNNVADDATEHVNWIASPADKYSKNDVINSTGSTPPSDDVKNYDEVHTARRRNDLKLFFPMNDDAQHGDMKQTPNIIPLSPDQNNASYATTENVNYIASPANEYPKNDVINPNGSTPNLNDDHNYNEDHTARCPNDPKPFSLMKVNAEHGDMKQTPNITPLSSDQNNVSYDATAHVNGIVSPADEDSKNDTTNHYANENTTDSIKKSPSENNTAGNVATTPIVTDDASNHSDENKYFPSGLNDNHYIDNDISPSIKKKHRKTT
eukprot:CAMPEP_0172482502 /NCGR_PEP_ID=MMETSP1066-20121228/8931_1 /TAXON_ID=671091 /ORGANISM="Coscinodiscus wailesii, Strain CCMP2513" /LENGTH=361 /DNA_ID=CAMNT_0013245661 /DNA_START=451 /DNA_END=1536 /DNA_ORIENTATION=+